MGIENLLPLHMISPGFAPPSATLAQKSVSASIVGVAPSTPTTGISGFFSRKLVGPVTVGEVGLGAAALAIVTKFMKVW